MNNLIKGMYFGDVLPFGEIHPLHTECNQKAAKVLEAEKRILAAFPIQGNLWKNTKMLRWSITKSSDISSSFWESAQVHSSHWS